MVPATCLLARCTRSHRASGALFRICLNTACQSFLSVFFVPNPAQLQISVPLQGHISTINRSEVEVDQLDSLVDFYRKRAIVLIFLRHSLCKHILLYVELCFDQSFFLGAVLKIVCDTRNTVSFCSIR